MTTIRQHAYEYLTMRRGLGFKLTTFGQRLLSFVSDLEQRGATAITTDAAVAWAMNTPRSRDQVQWSHRLMVVRVFARHLATLDAATEIPPEDILPHHYRRIAPHVYSSIEIDALLAATDTMRPRLRAMTWRCLITLLAVTGMRTGEACRLGRHDIDYDDGVLVVHDSKFGKSRRIPVQVSAIDALRNYDRHRHALCRAVSAPEFFVNIHGRRLDEHNLPRTFAGLVETAGIQVPAGQRRPRLHDLRHSFAVATVLDWYRSDVDVSVMMPRLATYLGHADPKHTFWYLTGTPELLALASTRLDHAFGGQS